jgi:hypothetical protein
MRILCTHPGRAGDLLWALPCVRAVSEAFGQPVDLLTTGEFASLGPLLLQQPYVGEFCAAEGWRLSEGRTPSLFTGEWDRVYHLGYQRWPEFVLPLEAHSNLVQRWKDADGPVPAIDLARPWITATPDADADIACGFTEAWFELKLGLLFSVEWQLGLTRLVQCTPVGSRWTTETAGLCVAESDWLEAARLIAGATLFFGDCSALHVLAVALGTRVILCEPMEARWNPIFYPLGMDGPQVTIVRGNDGQPTFDARHCADALREALRG